MADRTIVGPAILCDMGLTRRPTLNVSSEATHSHVYTRRSKFTLPYRTHVDTEPVFFLYHDVAFCPVLSFTVMHCILSFIIVGMGDRWVIVNFSFGGYRCIVSTGRAKEDGVALIAWTLTVQVITTLSVSGMFVLSLLENILLLHPSHKKRHPGTLLTCHLGPHSQRPMYAEFGRGSIRQLKPEVPY